MRGLLTMLVPAMLVIPARASAVQSGTSPVVAQAKAGPCRMTISGGGLSFLVVVTGLAPSERLQVTSRSENEVGRWETNAEADGSYSTIVLPAVKGKTFGVANLEVAGQRCRIEGSYSWRE